MTPPPSRRPSAVTVVLAVAITALALVGVAGCRLVDPDGQPEATPSAPAPLPATGMSEGLCHPPPPLAPADLQDLADHTTTTPVSLPASTPAAPDLSLLSGAILATSCDRDAAGTGFDYVQLQQWAADTAIENGRATSSIVLFQEQRWRAADGSGRVISTRYPDDGPPPSTSAGSDVRYQPGDLLSVVPAGDPAKPATVPPPIATDPVELAAQFDAVQPRRMGPQSVLRAYADLAGWHTTTVEQRRAILTVLANTDGLRYHPGVVDRAGRAGVGVSVTGNSGDTRDLIILHPGTGQLLAYELAVLGNRVQKTTAPRVENYVLYLAQATAAGTDSFPQ